MQRANKPKIGICLRHHPKLTITLFEPGLVCTVKTGFMVSRLFLLQNSGNVYIHMHSTKHILYSRHHFIPSNCIFMQLQGIVFIQLRGNDILLTFKEIYSFK